MKYVYAALLLHESGMEVNEDNLKKVISSIGEVDEARIKVLTESLKDVNIDEAIKEASIIQAPATTEVKEEKKEEVKEEKKEEIAAEGLAALFG